MKKLCEKKFYLCCPDCRQRMKRVGHSGSDVMSYLIDYHCRCGACWSYNVYRNGLVRGWSKEYRHRNKS
jgi:hypothetical protein